MTDHGFGKGTVYSREAPSPDTIRRIAEHMSPPHVPGVIEVHVVSPHPMNSKACHCDIIFQFDYPQKHGYKTLDELLKRIQEEVTVEGHKIRINEVWIIQESYKEKLR